MGESLSQKEFDDLIEDFDQDHDGFLSFQEFCSLVNWELVIFSYKRASRLSLAGYINQYQK